MHSTDDYNDVLLPFLVHISRKILKLFTSTYSDYSHLQKYRKTNQLIGSKED